MAEQVRVQLMLEWMEKNPRAVTRVQEQLKNLHMTYMRSAKGLRQMGMDEARLTRTLEIAREQYQKEQTGIVDVAHSREFTTNVLKRLTKEEEKHAVLIARQRINLRRLGQQMTRAGYRMGWMGFRMTIMGRLITRWIQKPIQDTIKLMVDWEKSIETVAEAMGMLAYAGELTGERQDFLMDTMMEILRIGPEFEAMWLYLKSAISSVLLSVGEPLIDLFEELSEVIVEAGPEIKEILTPAIEDLVDVFIELLPEMKDLALEVLPSFIKGIGDAALFMVSLFEAVGPLLPHMSEFLGYMVGISPLLVPFGTAMYMMSPGIIAFAEGFRLAQLYVGHLVGYAATGTGTLATFKIAVAALAIEVAILATAAWTIYVAWGYVTGEAQASTKSMEEMADWMDEANTRVEKGARMYVGLGKSVEFATRSLEAFGESKEFIKAVTEEMERLYMESVGKSWLPEIVEWTKKAEMGLKDLGEEIGGIPVTPGRGGGPGYGGPSEVIVYVTQYITGGVGLDPDETADLVADAASRGLGRAFRRRFR